MGKIDKALNKFSAKERLEIKNVFLKLKSGNVKELNVKKLKGHLNIFRVRKGNIRIIFLKDKKYIFILTIERRREDTYKF